MTVLYFKIIWFGGGSPGDPATKIVCRLDGDGLLDLLFDASGSTPGIWKSGRAATLFDLLLAETECGLGPGQSRLKDDEVIPLARVPVVRVPNNSFLNVVEGEPHLSKFQPALAQCLEITLGKLR